MTFMLLFGCSSADGMFGRNFITAYPQFARSVKFIFSKQAFGDCIINISLLLYVGWQVAEILLYLNFANPVIFEIQNKLLSYYAVLFFFFISNGCLNPALLKNYFPYLNNLCQTLVWEKIQGEYGIWCGKLTKRIKLNFEPP